MTHYENGGLDFLTDPFLIDKDRLTGSVLVTGAGGCIGAWVCAILARSGINVIASDLQKAPARLSLIMDGDSPTLDWVSLDVTDGDAVTGIVDQYNVHAIVHLAGLQVPFCAANPALGARVNVEGTINILQAARNLGVKRTVFASSVAAHSFPVGGRYKETLYGAYKIANEQTAFVYWADWQVPSICLRPNVVYGVGRDQGISSKNTIGIQAAVLGDSYDIPFTGPYSWLYAGEAAAAFIAAISRDGEGAHVFDLNGRCDTIETGIATLDLLAPEHKITASGEPFLFPPDLDETPFRSFAPDYPTIEVVDGITSTYRAFSILNENDRLPPLPK